MTANGSPSGTATTTIVIPIIKYSSHSWQYVIIYPSGCSGSSPPKKSKVLFEILSMKNLKKSTWIVRRAQYIPTLPISVPIFSNFSWRGVISMLYSNFAIILPTQLSFPTTMHTYQPSPVTNCVPDNNIGDGKSWWFLWGSF